MRQLDFGKESRGAHHGQGAGHCRSRPLLTGITAASVLFSLPLASRAEPCGCDSLSAEAVRESSRWKPAWAGRALLSISLGPSGVPGSGSVSLSVTGLDGNGVSIFYRSGPGFFASVLESTHWVGFGRPVSIGPWQVRARRAGDGYHLVSVSPLPERAEPAGQFEPPPSAVAARQEGQAFIVQDIGDSTVTFRDRFYPFEAMRVRYGERTKLCPNAAFQSIFAAYRGTEPGTVIISRTDYLMR
jgi:hypothetical protein